MTPNSKLRLSMIFFIIEYLRLIRLMKNVIIYARQLSMKKINWKTLYLINALSRTMFFITRIVYKYLNHCIRLQFKKYTINLRAIILKLHAYTNYSNVNIIERIWESRWLYTLIIITRAKELKLQKIVNMIYYNHFLSHKNADKTFLWIS